MIPLKYRTVLPSMSLVCASMVFGNQSDDAGAMLLDALNINTMTATFSQVVRNIETSKEVSVSSGRMSFAKPNLLKWAYDEPINQIFIKKNQIIYMFDKDLLQLSKLNQSSSKKTPFDFMTLDYRDLKTFYTIEKINISDTVSGLSLKPKNEISDHYQVIIVLKDKLIHQIEIFYRIGRVIEINFEKVKVNLTFSKNEFDLDLPSNIAIEEIK